ncbi:MAG: ribonuclease P protein component [Rickettsiales bacterium]|nr:ribonuclease P protein component [Rickettsiales bacterium]|tara:strand:- start:329 stop:658 length:330 start_codon:yes stop_codon:yes gene_type:complete
MRLRKRADFLRCAAVGRKSVTHAFILQSLPGYDPEASAIWLGFTATKKTGNAVIRNRLKRRLRALAREVIPSDGIAGTAYVLIARKNCVHYPYDRLKQDLHDALRHLSR